jgi:hypothetical protein
MYIQAHLNDFAIFWKQIDDLFKKKDYKGAGEALVGIEEGILRNASRWNFHFEELKAFHNGMFFWMNVTSPDQMSHCYNNGTGRIGIEFFKQWASLISLVNPLDSFEATKEYLDGAGGKLLEKFQSVINCFMKTDDLGRLNDAYGFNINESEFLAGMVDFIGENQEVFWNIMKKMHYLFDVGCDIGAGMYCSEFYRLVANSMKDQDLSFYQYI